MAKKWEIPIDSVPFVTTMVGTVSQSDGYVPPLTPNQAPEDEVTEAAVRTDFEHQALDCLAHVERFAFSLARVRADADDLVQDTYLRAFRSRHTFQPDGNMKGWLFTICKHVFLRSRERATREVVSFDEDPTDITLGTVRLHNTLVASGDAALFDRVDLAAAIVRALNALSPPARMVVELVDGEGYGYADASALLDIPVGTVRSRLFRARRALQELLIEYGRDAGLVPSEPQGTERSVV